MLKIRTARLFVYFILMVVFTGQGCAPFFSWLKDDEEIESRVYPMPYQVVWETIPGMFKGLGVELVDENKNKGYFLAETRMSSLSHGERITVAVEKIDATKTKVYIQSKRVWANDVASENWKIPMLDELDELLGVASHPQKDEEDAPWKKANY